MKLNTADLFRKWQFPLLTISAIAPVGPSLFCYLLPDRWALSWVFPAVCLMLACFGMLLESKLRKPYGWVCFALQLILGFLLLPKIEGINEVFMLFVPLIYCVLLLIILPMADLPATKEPHSGIFILGLFLYPIWQILYQVRLTGGDPTMMPAKGGILVCFLLFLVLCLLSRNRSALVFASTGRYSLPKVMYGVNGILVLIFLGAVLLLGAVPSIGKLLAAPIVWAFQGLGAVLTVFLERKPGGLPAAPTQAEEAMEETLDGQIFEPNTNLAQATKLPDVVMQILLVVFVLIFAYFVGRVLVMLVKFLMKLLSKLVSSSEYSAEEGYTDEISDVRDTVTALSPQKRARSAGTRRLHAMTGEEQIRHRYRVLKKRHPKWQSSDTVRHQLPEEAARLYERTRYGGKEASAADAKAFEQNTRGL